LLQRVSGTIATAPLVRDDKPTRVDDDPTGDDGQDGELSSKITATDVAQRVFDAVASSQFVLHLQPKAIQSVRLAPDVRRPATDRSLTSLKSVRNCRRRCTCGAEYWRVLRSVTTKGLQQSGV
jgi:hypothetical protein